MYSGISYVISIDYMLNAVKLWKNSREEYYVYPEHFQPETILDMGEQSLKTIVKRVGARFPSTGARMWKEVSKILLERYDGESRRIIETPLSIEEIKGRIVDFPYLKGNKLSNFYLRAIGENQLFTITDLEELDIPVDIQVASKKKCGQCPVKQYCNKSFEVKLQNAKASWS